MRKPYFDNPDDVENNKKSANVIIGKRLKELRTSNKPKKDTQLELARFLKLGKKKDGGKQTISNAERGVRCLPANLLPIIADKYNTSVESFFTDDKIYILSENIFYKLISKLKTDDNTKMYATKYMGFLMDRAVESIGAEKLFDITYTVLREASFGNTNGMSIGADIDAINRVHSQNNEKSMCLGSSVSYAKELMDDPDF